MHPWLEEFYPVTAFKAVSDPNRTPVTLLKHAIRKWEGLGQLDAYGLRASSFYLIDIKTERRVLDNNGNACTLCVDHYECEGCPIAPMRGSCFTSDGEAWKAWTSDRNPEPMLALLKTALANAEADVQASAHPSASVDPKIQD